MAANFGRGGAYAPLPTEEHVAVCTRDGDSVRCWGGEVRERVVRCRDCKHYEPNTYSYFTCELLTFHVQPDGFCSWGVRKED